MRRRTKSDNAEVGTSAMIIFIAVVLVSSIVASLIIGVGGNIFNQKTDAQQNIPSFKGITNVVVMEIFTLDQNNPGTDEIHLVFELPHVEIAVDEEDLSWVVMCDMQVNGGGTGNRVQFDQGDFTTATTLVEDGRTAGSISEFDPGVDYRMIIQLSECDLDQIESAKLILIVDKGRTQEWGMNIGSAPYVGQDLN